MVVIKNSCTIVPAEPTPNIPLPLSECDQSMVWSLAPTFYTYQPNPSFSFYDVVDTLKSSLSRVLVPFYPMAGRLRWIGGGRLILDCNAAGVEFTVAKSESKMDEFGDFHPTPKIKPILPKVDYDRPIEHLPAMDVQVTGFACGGVCLALAISHVLLDGWSALNMIKCWAKLARGETLADHELPFHDRTLFKAKELGSPHRFDHVEFKPWPVLLGRSDDKEEQAKETTAAMLKLSVDQVEQLKSKANKDVHGHGHQKPYTRFEAITGHIWRSACKARELDPEQATVVRLMVDCRNRVKPPLPKGFTGNTILRTITDPRCVSGDIVAKPLSYAAGKVRESVWKMTEEYIESALGFIASQEDVSWMRASFHVVGSRSGQFLGNPNLSVTSWIGLPIHESDFGWGKPSFMGPGALVSDGKCFIIPDSDGSLIVAMRIQKAHVDLFNKFFYEDI